MITLKVFVLHTLVEVSPYQAFDKDGGGEVHLIHTQDNVLYIICGAAKYGLFEYFEMLLY